MGTVIWTDKMYAEGKKRSFLHRLSKDVSNLKTNDLKAYGEMEKGSGVLHDWFDPFQMTCA